MLLRDIATIKEKVGAIEGRLDSVDTELISLKNRTEGDGN